MEEVGREDIAGVVVGCVVYFFSRVGRCCVLVFVCGWSSFHVGFFGSCYYYQS